MNRIDGKTMEELRQECSLLTTAQLKAELERRGSDSKTTVDLLQEISQKLDNRSAKEITKADILAIEDYRERQRMMEEHLDLFR